MGSTSLPDVPGTLLVMSQPKPDAKEYHHWYDTEHGPERMQFDPFLTGTRYKVIAKSMNNDPVPSDDLFLAQYDLSRLSGLQDKDYKSLKMSSQESRVLKEQIAWLDRAVFKQIYNLGKEPAKRAVIITANFTVKQENAQKLLEWYEKEHIPLLSKISGWQRSRRYELIEASDFDQGKLTPRNDRPPPGCTEFLALHEYEAENGIWDPEDENVLSKDFKALGDTPWRDEMMKDVEYRTVKFWTVTREMKAEDYRKPE